MKKWKFGMFLAAMVFCLGLLPSMAVQAGSLTILEMLQTEKEVEAKAEPKDSAKTEKVYEAGETLLIVEGGTQDWYAVAYQGEVYYVKKSQMEGTFPVAEIEEGDSVKERVMDENFQEELEAELEVDKYESKTFVESYERYLSEVKQKRIWGIIIGILFAAVLGVSIYSHVSSKKK